VLGVVPNIALGVIGPTATATLSVAQAVDPVAPYATQEGK